MKYNIKCSCGHEDTVELFGKTADREKRIAYLEKHGICRHCWELAQNERSSEGCEEVEMSYSAYKRQCPECKTKIGSYNKETKTIIVYVPVGEY